MKRPKLIIVGHARHGKDTVCEMLAEFGYTWQSSSWLCGQIAVWPFMKTDYPTYEACFADRHNHRAFWFETIKAFNTPDQTRLAREILSQSDIYCGMRRFEELSACKDAKVCDMVVWVDASKRVEPEPKTSMTIKGHQAHYVIDNNGDLTNLRSKVIKFYNGVLNPWTKRMNESRCMNCGSIDLNKNQIADTTWCQACGKVQA
jgi:hypothetical protein